MEEFLRSFLPRILPPNWVQGKNYSIHPHRGKTDLQKSIRNKVRGYRKYHHPVKLLIIHDQDNNDCRVLKANLERIVRNNDQQIPLLIRIACRELENWYLGDLKAISQVYPKVKPERYINKAKFRDPDKLNGAQKMKKLSKDFQKTACAKKMGALMDISVQNNRSSSFRCFVAGVLAFCPP